MKVQFESVIMRAFVLGALLFSTVTVYAGASPSYEILNQYTTENKQCCGLTMFSRTTRVTGLLPDSDWGVYLLQETWNSVLFTGAKRLEAGAIYEFGPEAKGMGMVSRFGLGLGYHFGLPSPSTLALDPSILYVSPMLWKFSVMVSAEAWMFSDSSIFSGELGLVVHRLFSWPISVAVSYPMRTWFKLPFSEVRTDFGAISLHVNVRF